MRRMNLRQPALPLRPRADRLIRPRMKVPVPAILPTPKDDARHRSVCPLVRQPVRRREPHSSQAQLRAQANPTRQLLPRNYPIQRHEPIIRPLITVLKSAFFLHDFSATVRSQSIYTVSCLSKPCFTSSDPIGSPGSRPSPPCCSARSSASDRLPLHASIVPSRHLPPSRSKARSIHTSASPTTSALSRPTRPSAASPSSSSAPPHRRPTSSNSSLSKPTLPLRSFITGSLLKTSPLASAIADADIAATQSWLQSHGFTIDSVSHDSITFSGNAAQIHQAFGAELHRFRSGSDTEPELHFAPASELSLPPTLVPVTAAVLHLSDFRPRPNFSTIRPDYTTLTSQSHFLAPKDVATMYDLAPLVANVSFPGRGPEHRDRRPILRPHFRRLRRRQLPATPHRAHNLHLPSVRTQHRQ